MSSQSLRNIERIVLASASPVRRRLLEAAGLNFEVLPSRIDEEAVRSALLGDGDNIDPGDLAEVLARTKADDVIARTDARHVVGADQILAFDGEIFSKPADADEARAHLLALRGQTHVLHSAVVIAEDGDIVWAHVDSVRVTLRQFSPAFVGRYLADVGDDALASVGCYQLEGLGIQLIEKIEGDYHTVLGLPLLALLNELRARGVLQS